MSDTTLQPPDVSRFAVVDELKNPHQLIKVLEVTVGRELIIASCPRGLRRRWSGRSHQMRRIL